MKRYLTLAAVSALLVCSCQREEPLAGSTQAGETKIVHVSLAGSSDTKTFIQAGPDGGYSFKWSEGDIVRINEFSRELKNASVKKTYLQTIDSDTAVASFDVEVDAVDPEDTPLAFIATYPGYGTKIMSSEQSLISLEIPQVQSCDTKSFDSFADLMVSKPVFCNGVPDSLSFQFTRVGSIVHLKLNGLDHNADILSVFITTNDNIAGTVKYDYNTQTYTEIEGHNMIQVSMEDCSTDNEGKLDVWFRTFPAEIDSMNVKVSYDVGRGEPRGAERNFIPAAHSGVPAMQFKEGAMFELGLNMSAIYAEDFSLNTYSLDLKVGEKFKLTSTMIPREAIRYETWDVTDISGKNVIRLGEGGVITAQNMGTARVEVRVKTETGATLYHECFVTVAAPPKHTAVDLGLPSGTKWASLNIGAYDEFDAGTYFAWADIETKDHYTLETQIYSGYTSWGYQMTKYTSSALHTRDSKVDSKYLLDTEDDVAMQKWGGDWRMPTRTEAEELRNYCTITDTVMYVMDGEVAIDSVMAYLYTSNVNGNQIIMPRAGYISDQTLNYDPDVPKAYYWTCERPIPTKCVYIRDFNTLAYVMDDCKNKTAPMDKGYGACVRPVCGGTRKAMNKDVITGTSPIVDGTSVTVSIQVPGATSYSTTTDFNEFVYKVYYITASRFSDLENIINISEKGAPACITLTREGTEQTLTGTITGLSPNTLYYYFGYYEEIDHVRQVRSYIEFSGDYTISHSDRFGEIHTFKTGAAK